MWGEESGKAKDESACVRRDRGYLEVISRDRGGDRDSGFPESRGSSSGGERSSCRRSSHGMLATVELCTMSE